jgi:hypothetical protein
MMDDSQCGTRPTEENTRIPDDWENMGRQSHLFILRELAACLGSELLEETVYMLSFDPDAAAGGEERPYLNPNGCPRRQGRRSSRVGRLVPPESFPALLPMATISTMAVSHENTGSRLMARAPVLLLLLAALAAPAKARSTPENRIGEKSAQNTELHLSRPLQTLELERGKASPRWYDVSDDSFTWKERSGEAD